MTYKDDKFSLSVDAYMITVEDRISMSETFKGSGTTSNMVSFFAEEVCRQLQVDTSLMVLIPKLMV